MSRTSLKAAGLMFVALALGARGLTQGRAGTRFDAFTLLAGPVFASSLLRAMTSQEIEPG